MRFSDLMKTEFRQRMLSWFLNYKEHFISPIPLISKPDSGLFYAPTFTQLISTWAKVNRIKAMPQTN